MRFYIWTIGCQMNEKQTEELSSLLKMRGDIEVDSPESADIIILNTCSVRRRAEVRIEGRIGEFKRLKEKNNPIIVVAGCYAQAHREKILERFPYVDKVVGPFDFMNIPELLNDSGKLYTDEKRTDWKIILPERAKVSSFVRIMEGCNNFCSYCIVPYVRGRERSKPSSMVIEEVAGLVERGAKEVVLLGQNVNSYGKDIPGEVSFAQLLYKLNDVEGLERIRFTTSHPKDMSDELIEAMAELPKVCEHLHLPVQGGNDRILKLMNRGYTKAQYRALVDKIRDKIPGIALTTDIIVGYPTETEEEFQELLEFIREIRFDQVYSAIFSRRPMAKASELPDLPYEIKQKRYEIFNQVQNEISREINEKLIGTIQDVLIEEVKTKFPDQSKGRTRTNKVVVVEKKIPPGEIIMVKIMDATEYTLKGEIL
ncbi:MAG: tRNA (N6-isopentenyl adenosine(37)-C2)-methylthiotransferase MiaB [Dictyoglomi bacterium]|nr:tRNA (N6-isopentenyl adenosine(37)-C2)-methylthiotransferase MiaB [Dictyoglomota bacterium]